MRADYPVLGYQTIDNLLLPAQISYGFFKKNNNIMESILSLSLKY